MTTFLDEHATVIGMLSLAFVFIFLFSSPSMIFAKQITVIGSDLHSSAGSQIHVRTQMDFGNKDKVQNFPKRIANYYGTNCDSTSLTESLKADVALMRSYRSPATQTQIFLLILQSKNRSSFHPPTVCYPALGYEIVQESDEEITIQNESWMESPWMGEKKHCASFTLKKLVVSNGKEQRIVLYFYVKPQQLLSDEITLILISAVSYPGGQEQVLNSMKLFTSEIFPLMFEHREEEQISAVLLLRSGGIFGLIAIILLFFFPIALIVYPKLR